MQSQWKGASTSLPSNGTKEEEGDDDEENADNEGAHLATQVCLGTFLRRNKY